MRLLLIEDEKRMAQALCELLRLEKYEVDHYANGLDGLTAIESGLYDVVVLEQRHIDGRQSNVVFRVLSQGLLRLMKITALSVGREPVCYAFWAITSTSTSAPLGSALAATQERAGFSVKYWA